MKKQLLISILIAATVALAAPAQVTRHVVKISDFTRLNLLDDINVNYRCNPDPAGLIVMDCSQDVASHLIFSINDKKRLSIQVDDSYERQGNLPTLTIYSSTLDEAENAGDSTLRINGLPPLKAFKLRNIDNGISLCDVNDIERGIRSLREALKDGTRIEGRAPLVQLFEVLLEAIRRDYGRLLETDKIEFIDLVRWAYRKEFWQQTLTLIESRAPQELIDKGF